MRAGDNERVNARVKSERVSVIESGALLFWVREKRGACAFASGLGVFADYL